MGSAVYTFPRSRHLKVHTCMHFLQQNGQTVVTRACCCWFLQQGLQSICFSKWQCQGVLRPLQRHQCSLSWVTDVFLDNWSFLLFPKPAVHIAGDIILYGQWPGQGQSVLKWLCQRPKSTGTPGPLVSEHMTSSFPDFWLLARKGLNGQ